jgi:mannan endo-1,6-alpha-mannosidase
MASQAATALGLATGEGGSLLGDDAWLSEQILGKWNDDIMWWGLAVLTGAELYGLDAHMPNKITYLKSAQITYDQVWQQWDTKCGGGIYWVRDRKRDSKKGYKSSITNGFLK